MRLTAALATTFFLTVAACGNETLDDSDQESDRPAAWVDQRLAGEAGADNPTILTAGEQGVLVATTSEDGVLQTHLSLDGYDFVAGEPLATELTYPGLGGVAAHDGGWFALGSGGLEEVEGDDEITFEAMGVRSSDGLKWEAVPLTGFTGPADIAALLDIGGSLVAVGAYRGAEDPSMGGFRATAWRSADGMTWTEVGLPGAGTGDSYVAALAASGDRLFAAGATNRRAAIWTSVDEGATWSRLEEPAVVDAYAAVDVVAQGTTVVLSLEDDGPRVLRSDDGGRTWAEASVPPPADGAEGYAPLWSGGGRFFSVTSVFIESWSEPEVCYADIALCLQDSAVALYASDDGDRWARVDTSGIGSGEDGEVDQVIGTPAGAVVALRGSGDHVSAYTWPAGRNLPTEGESATPRAALVEVPQGGDPEPGVRYHAPLYLHCGMDWLYLGGAPWQRVDDGSEVETGAGEEGPSEWPVAQQTLFGYATATTSDMVEYALEDGEVIATYARTGQQPPGCD